MRLRLAALTYSMTPSEALELTNQFADTTTRRNNMSEETEATPDDTTEDELSTAVDSSEESGADTTIDTKDQAEEGDTFPRSYVERLRRESAGYRERAQTADTYAKRLHLELVRATGKLADPPPTSSSTRNMSTIPTPWPPPSTTCWAANRTSRPAGRPVKSDREPHLRPRVALTLPQFCANEPDKEGTWVTSQS
jgi:hypothetical protein